MKLFALLLLSPMFLTATSMATPSSYSCDLHYEGMYMTQNEFFGSATHVDVAVNGPRVKDKLQPVEGTHTPKGKWNYSFIITAVKDTELMTIRAEVTGAENIELVTTVPAYLPYIRVQQDGMHFFFECTKSAIE